MYSMGDPDTNLFSSLRGVDDGRNYGLTMKPRNLFEDKNHFFIWCFVDENEEHKCIVMSVKDYKKVRGDALNRYSFRIGQNLRQHIDKGMLKKGKKDWSVFLNEFKNLE